MIDMKLLRRVQYIQLDILKVVSKICTDHNIKYYLIGGTLLGAVRHKGFIPWDDDLDIAMMRSDYNKFIEVCKKELPHDLFLQNSETEKNFWLFITKIRKNNTRFDDNITIKTKNHPGIYIDIFPLDNVPEKDSIIQKLQYNGIRLLTSVMLYKNGYREYNSNIVKRVSAILSILPYTVIVKFSSLLTNIYNKKETGFVTSFMSNYGYKKQKMNKIKVYGNGKKLLFEDEEFFVPYDYEAYLTQIFNDYMQLPPVEERGIRHKRLNIEIGEN